MATEAPQYLLGLIPVNGLAWLIVAWSIFLILNSSRTSHPLPLVNGGGLLGVTKSQLRKQLTSDLPQLITAGFRKGNVFRLLTPGVTRVVLAPEYANELRNHPGLRLGPALAYEHNGHIPAFEAFAEYIRHDIIPETIRTRLSRDLAKFTRPLSVQTSALLKDMWTDDPNWHDVNPQTTTTNMIAQQTSIVFVGEEVGQNPKWVHAVVNYASEVFSTADELNVWPRVLRPMVAQFHPSCRKLQHYIRDARSVLLPAIAKRSDSREDGRPQNHDDAIQWLEHTAKDRPYDPVLSQLFLAIAAIHTSSRVLSQVLLDLCERSDLVQELRKEIVSVLQQTGWEKVAFSDLKLMDSVIKESQRLNPLSLMAMDRYSTRDVELSDGIVIPKGSSIFIADLATQDPKIYTNPHMFDPYRFATLREAGDRSAHLVSLSPTHLLFGVGRHACPGRFYVANQLKIILCHILLKYDLKSNESCQSTAYKDGLHMGPDPGAQISVRRTHEEISLET